MTDTALAQAEPVLVAIDIAKARHDVFISVPGRTRRRRLTVLNRLDDFNRLIAAFSEYDYPVRAVFETTGNCHRIVTHSLSLCWPEAERLQRSMRRRRIASRFFAFLERYPSSRFISAMDQEAISVDGWEVVGRKVSKERFLTDSYQSAKSSVGLPIAQASDAARMFRPVLGEGRSLIAQRSEIEDRVVERLKTNDDD